jgi:glutathione synthase/RimK-type ligase-like ATP-grasp enzyme
MGPGNMLNNTPLDFILDRGDVRLDLLFVDASFDPATALVPDHDVAMVAVGYSTESLPLLARLDHILAQWPRPVLNRPACILRCQREVAATLLAGIAGLVVPPMRPIARNTQEAITRPSIIRPVDSHAGEGLARVDTDAELRQYLADRPEAAFLLSDYHDYRSADGYFRKYRIALVAGQAYLCHLAISDHWVVHYQSAGMEKDHWKRDEEAAAMAGFATDFARRHAAALAALHSRLGLDYVVIDCAETTDGALLFFEADSRAWIHATDAETVFPYKTAVMQAVLPHSARWSPLQPPAKWRSCRFAERHQFLDLAQPCPLGRFTTAHALALLVLRPDRQAHQRAIFIKRQGGIARLARLRPVIDAQIQAAHFHRFVVVGVDHQVDIGMRPGAAR